MFSHLRSIVIVSESDCEVASCHKMANIAQKHPVNLLILTMTAVNYKMRVCHCLFSVFNEWRYQGSNLNCHVISLTDQSTSLVYF